MIIISHDSTVRELSWHRVPGLYWLKTINTTKVEHVRAVGCRVRGQCITLWRCCGGVRWGVTDYLFLRFLTSIFFSDSTGGSCKDSRLKTPPGRVQQWHLHICRNTTLTTAPVTNRFWCLQGVKRGGWSRFRGWTGRQVERTVTWNQKKSSTFCPFMSLTALLAWVNGTGTLKCYYSGFSCWVYTEWRNGCQLNVTVGSFQLLRAMVSFFCFLYFTRLEVEYESGKRVMEGEAQALWETDDGYIRVAAKWDCRGRCCMGFTL